jgi:DNA-binding NarL/FixJ family response regulator
VRGSGEEAGGTYTVLVQGGGGTPTQIGARYDAIAVGHTGLAFRSAVQAVRCAVAIEEAAAAAIGLHAGEIGPGDPVAARPVVLAARLATLAREGQALASALVRDLAGADPELRFGAAREVSLPGLAGRMTVHEIRWGERSRRPLRVVIADDAALVRDGVAALLRDHGVEVAATASDAAELHEAVARHLPDVALVDIRMPPTFTDEGLAAAERIRAGFPEVGVLVLSQHLDARYALRVADRNPARTGYLLKDRVTDSRILFDALQRIADGGCVIDPAVAEGLVSRASALARIDELTEREREVLALVAGGLSNAEIAEHLVVSPATSKTHVSRVMAKLNARDRAQLVMIAYETGLVQPGS